MAQTPALYWFRVITWTGVVMVQAVSLDDATQRCGSADSKIVCCQYLRPVLPGETNPDIPERQ